MESSRLFHEETTWMLIKEGSWCKDEDFLVFMHVIIISGVMSLSKGEVSWHCTN
jgi:hypothetical protein